MIAGSHNIHKSRKKAIMKQIREARKLASDLNLDEIQLRKLISRSFAMTESWLRKLLPESLKFTNHARKDYLERKQQRDQQQQLMQPQQQHSELIELPASRQPALEQQQLQQPSDEKATKITTSDNELAELPQQTQKEEEEEEEKLKQRIEELQRENKYLREITATQGQQLQQQEEETFTALGQLQLRNFLMPIKVYCL
jgi:hypothetical protein